MNICWFRCLILFSVAIALEPLELPAQLGQTKVGEYWIGVRSIYRSGDSSDLDSNLALHILKRDLDGAERLNPLKVIRAEDDTGQNLVRFRNSKVDSIPQRMRDGFFATVDLKSPATNARCIKILECEGQLVSDTNRAKATTLRFVLENIRLPWVDPPDVEVTVTPVQGFGTMGNDQTTLLRLTFFGGEITNLSGIRRLTINRAETESGELLNVVRKNDATSLLLTNADGWGRIVEKFVVLETPLGRPGQLKALTGEAELWKPSRANGGIVELNEFLGRADNLQADEALNRIGVKLEFLGRDNFETRRKEWKDKRATFTTIVPRTPSSSEAKDSLLLSLDDPAHRVVKLEFLDEAGEALPEMAQMISTATLDLEAEQLRLYTFKTPPPDKVRLRVCLATPESLGRIAFDVKNIALP